MSVVPVLLVVSTACGRTVEDVPVQRDVPAARVLRPGCAGSPYPDIQDAIDAAVNNDVIEVCPGTYTERLTVSAKTLTLRSRDGADDTVIDATLGGRALSVTSGAHLTVEGFTFRNGSTSTGTGGNVRCTGSDLVVRDNVFEDGVAWRGGGLGMTTCTGLVEDNTFRDNHATYRGGGLYLDGTLDILRNAFEANVSDVDAGAAYVSFGSGIIRDNTVIGNTSEDDGGGIYTYQGEPWVDSNTFEANDSSEEGGGLRIKSSSALITDNVFLNNHADWRGGAMKVSHDDSILSGNLYVGNSTWGYGGASLLFESASDLSFETYQDNEADEGGAIAIIEGWAAVRIEDSTFEDNVADRGGHLWIDLFEETTKLRRVDLIGGEADEGGAVYATVGSDIDFRNVVFANNVASDTGGALQLDGVTGEIYNAVAMWNEAPDGSAMWVANGALLSVKNTVFRQNTTGAAVRKISGLSPVFRYNDFYQNTSDFLGMGSVVGSNGNISVSTGFVNAAGGDFGLTGNSALVDAGDPTISDADGTRSDIGRFGGPEAF